MTQLRLEQTLHCVILGREGPSVTVTGGEGDMDGHREIIKKKWARLVVWAEERNALCALSGPIPRLRALLWSWPVPPEGLGLRLPLQLTQHADDSEPFCYAFQSAISNLHVFVFISCCLATCFVSTARWRFRGKAGTAAYFDPRYFPQIQQHSSHCPFV